MNTGMTEGRRDVVVSLLGRQFRDLGSNHRCTQSVFRDSLFQFFINLITKYYIFHIIVQLEFHDFLSRIDLF